MLKGCFRGVSRVFSKFFQEVSMMSQKSLKGVLELKDKNHFLHCIIIFLPFPLIVVMKNSWDLVLGGFLYNFLYSEITLGRASLKEAIFPQ